MTLTEAAEWLGIDKTLANEYMLTCNEVVESEHFVAVLRGATAHVAVKFDGLAGRGVLRTCRDILARWVAAHGTIYAPVKKSNGKAVRFAEAVGFRKYGETPTHFWFLATERPDHEHTQPH